MLKFFKTWTLPISMLAGASPKTITFQGQDVKASLVELDNRLVEDLTVTEKKGASSMRLSIPRYGIRTLKVSCKNI